MPLTSFLNIQPSVEYGSAKQPNHGRKHGIESAKYSRDDYDKFKSSLRADDSNKIDKSCKSEACDSKENLLYVQDAQGDTVEIPLSSRQLQHLANLDRVSLVDSEILEKFGGLHAFVDALKSLLPGTPELSSDDLVSLPYQIEALSEEHFGSETFPHLIATNLSPAELNVLVRQLEGVHAGTAISQINQQNLNKPTSVVFVPGHNDLLEHIDIKSVIEDILSGSDEDLSGELISAAQLYIGTENVGFGKWFQRPAMVENKVSLREVISEQVNNMGAEGGVASSFISDNASNKQSAVFGKIVSYFAQHGAEKSMVKGALNGQGLGHGLANSIMSSVLDAGLSSFDLDAHLHSISTTPAVANASLQSLHAHGVLGEQKAGQAHQATQLVATNIQKAAENGGNQKLSFLLNPPELGKVQIDVEIDSSNKLKVRMVTEREAAYMLLQRDSHLLEQTLQDSGLDVDSGDIELSFAGNEFLFGGDDNQEYADFDIPANNASGEDGDIDADLTETQIDVFRDPYTGMWHCNIVV